MRGMLLCKALFANRLLTRNAIVVLVICMSKAESIDEMGRVDELGGLLDEVDNRIVGLGIFDGLYSNQLAS
jgi:hypothetical protein